MRASEFILPVTPPGPLPAPGWAAVMLHTAPLAVVLAHVHRGGHWAGLKRQGGVAETNN